MFVKRSQNIFQHTEKKQDTLDSFHVSRIKKPPENKKFSGGDVLVNKFQIILSKVTYLSACAKDMICDSVNTTSKTIRSSMAP